MEAINVEQEREHGTSDCQLIIIVLSVRFWASDRIMNCPTLVVSALDNAFHSSFLFIFYFGGGWEGEMVEVMSFTSHTSSTPKYLLSTPLHQALGFEAQVA